MTTPMTPLNRRSFLAASTKLVAGGSLLTLAASPLLAQAPAPAARPKPPKPPAPPPEKVQAVVGQAHRSLEEVRKLVEETPLLANACWDWGGGDFETPLEAAAHTGQRAIAEYLLSKGARPSLYAAAMLGQLDLVKAHLANDPNAHAIPGPHGFTVLHCAKEGEATAVVEWLLAQGVPDVTHRPLNFVWPEGTKPPA
jgi:hypothetical protein